VKPNTINDAGPIVRVLALTRYTRLGASSRMRSLQYLPFFESAGIHVEVSPLFGDDYLHQLYSKRPTPWGSVANSYFRQALTLLRARKFDFVWIEKEIFPSMPAWVEMAMARLGVKYVVDYDDAIFHNYDLSSNPLKRMLAGKIDAVMRNAALVVCGNEYLAERARRAGAPAVVVVPTVVDLMRYSVSPPHAAEELVIGWIGSPSTAKYLDLLHPILAKLSLRMPLQLRVVGAQVQFPGVDVLCLPWSEETEVEYIRQFDIGLMPLLESPWERGKCGYKLIQYMACGVPVIASPVGVNSQLVRDGRNGYLASSEIEWTQAIERLHADVELRRTLGRQGREDVEKHYCVQVTSEQLAGLFRQLARGEQF